MVSGEDIQQEMLASLQPNLINHSQITRVTLFIKLFLVCLLSPQQDDASMRIEEKVRVN